MTDKVQKRLVTFEIITQGDRPVDISEMEKDALISGFQKVVANTIDLRYKNEKGNNDRHKFVGVDIRGGI